MDMETDNLIGWTDTDKGVFDYPYSVAKPSRNLQGWSWLSAEHHLSLLESLNLTSRLCFWAWDELHNGSS